MNPNPLYLEEQDPRKITIVLTPSEFNILENNYSKYVEIHPTLNPNEFTISTMNKQYAGYIVLPEDNIISIAPKVQRANVLLMLTYAYKELEFSDQEILFPENEDFHEILIGVLIKRLENLLKHGVLTSYTEIEDNLPYVRGRIVLTQQLRLNMILKHRTYCRYADLTQDILENQIIKYTLSYVIKHHGVREELKRLLIKLYKALEFVSLLRVVNEASFANLQFNRLNEGYKPILRICEILIKNGSIEVDALRNYESFAFLLDMNKLFEEFVREYLRQNLNPMGFEVAKGHTYLDDGKEIELKPDIEIKKKGQKHTVLIIDTKYKILEDRDIIRSDVSQVLDYCLVYNIKTGILLYPRLQTKTARSYNIRNTDIRIIVDTIDISSKSKNEFLHNLDVLNNAIVLTLKNHDKLNE